MEHVDIIGAQFAMDCHTLGVEPPPFPIRARYLHHEETWSIFIVPPTDAPIGLLVDWLVPTRPLRLEFERQGSVRAHLPSLPELWEDIFQGVDIETMRLEPDGSANVAVRGSRARLQRFAARLLDRQQDASMTRLGAVEHDVPILTGPQAEALRKAVVAGYYRIPRPLNLHELAQCMGITAASLSERLRRAEGRILTKYVEEGYVPPAEPHGGEGPPERGDA